MLLLFVIIVVVRWCFFLNHFSQLIPRGGDELCMIRLRYWSRFCVFFVHATAMAASLLYLGTYSLETNRLSALTTLYASTCIEVASYIPLPSLFSAAFVSFGFSILLFVIFFGLLLFDFFSSACNRVCVHFSGVFGPYFSLSRMRSIYVMFWFRQAFCIR